MTEVVIRMSTAKQLKYEGNRQISVGRGIFSRSVSLLRFSGSATREATNWKGGMVNNYFRIKSYSS